MKHSNNFTFNFTCVKKLILKLNISGSIDKTFIQDLYIQDNFLLPCAYPQLFSWKSAYGNLELPKKLKLEDSKSSKILHHADWYIFTGILKEHSASISSQSQAVN